MLSLRRWWARLWQPGAPQPEYIFGKPVSGDTHMIACHNVASVTYYATGPDGRRFPILTADGCPLNQYIQQGHVHATPSDLCTFVEVVPVGLVADPSDVASIECGGMIAMDEVWPEEMGEETDDTR